MTGLLNPKSSKKIEKNRKQENKKTKNNCVILVVDLGHGIFHPVSYE